MVISSLKTQPFEQILQHLNLHTLDSEQLLIFNAVPWTVYEGLLEYLGDSSYFRIVYDNGILQVMSPSSRHEIEKENIGILLEAYLLEKGIRFYSLGSTTWRKNNIKKGIEADKSYCFGNKKEIPDLAIEVVITSGGIDTLVIYKNLGVPEVWFWQVGKFSIYCLQDEEYIKSDKSQLLLNLDLDLLGSYVSWDEPFDAVLEFRQKIKGI